MAKQEQFTQADAESLISIAQDAPIPGGARQAAARSDLYQRFLGYYAGSVKPAPVPRPRKQRAVTAEELTQ